ncbi:MAG: cytochrome c oxidase subunit 3 [Burkholderiales bacterium]|nr:cytochrome c oxidase subunit 3 [Burkholderiales bacterium]
MGVVVWWLLRESTRVQPWAVQGPVPDVHTATLPRHAAKTALIVFLAVATSLFALFLSAYAMRIRLLDWSPLPQPRLLMVNTAGLVLASLAMEWTAFAARRGDQDRVRAGLAAAGLLTVAFVAGQLVVWSQLAGAGYFVATSAATGFFYLLTAVHGLHVLGGLVAWMRPYARARSGRDADAARLRLGVELCAIYWHFLLAVWIVLLAVLVSKDLGLSICSTAVPL